MYIKFNSPFDITNGTHAGVMSSCLIIILITSAIASFNSRIEYCRETIFLSTTTMTPNSSFLQYNTPYEDCRCSVKSNNLIGCITDIQAMTARISPLVSYAFQLYIIHELFSVTGKYSHIFRRICWVITMFMSIIVAIGAHGSTFLYYNTSQTICASGMFISCIAICLYIRSSHGHFSHGRHRTYRNRRLVQNNHDREIWIIVIVCSL